MSFALHFDHDEFGFVAHPLERTDFPSCDRSTITTDRSFVIEIESSMRKRPFRANGRIVARKFDDSPGREVVAAFEHEIVMGKGVIMC